ncbi:glycoside hydrolase family protein [Pedobacter rhizosphaerae]|uniref:Glycosyl hydrolases family 43 n=1 Tax=Pedobacter rhizosphaerae TaxID=390241 RepID=A0A1H9K606_9SPHI|nr:glycoside hydrolase family protein [Pedobacter rhizosphaerae]SEQ94488.1 Glycosyl hydrolases family 43 [Pedobacter rhizosphaerae]
MSYKLIIAAVCFLMFAHFNLKGQGNSDNLNLNKMLGTVDSTNMFQLDHSYVWCGSAVKGEDGQYYLFYSKWPHGKRSLTRDSMEYIFDGFKGWLKYSEIACAVSDKLNGPYKHFKDVLKGDSDTSRWDQFRMHNPQIRKFGGKYYLYYISNSFNKDYQLQGATPQWLHWMKYNSGQRIGVLIADSMDDLLTGKYVRSEQPIMGPNNAQTFEVAVNPSVTKGPDGNYYMIFKSRKPNVGNMTHWIATAKKPEGPFKMRSQVFTSAEMACEDPCICYDQDRKRFYAAVKYYSNSKKLVPQFGALALITSENGLDWKPARNPLISLRTLKVSNGEELALHNLERPFIVTDEKGIPTALFAAAATLDPSKTEAGAVAKEYNTFNISIPLIQPLKQKK